MIDFATLKTTKDDVRLISVIAKRALELGLARPSIDLVMDLEAAHSVNPLRLLDLSLASDADLMHDARGIVEHLDRETGEMRDCFSPRYAA